MKANRALLLACLLAAGAGNAHAASIKPSQMPNSECVGADTDEKMNACSGVQLEKWDKALNYVYQQAVELIETNLSNTRANNPSDHMRASLYTQQLEGLKQAERMWIAYRDANCGFYANNVNGMPIFSSNRCASKMSEDRTIELLYSVIGDGSLGRERIPQLKKEVMRITGKIVKRPFRGMIS
jgi:uncharacterized protein YecT (DUF1311 family)